MASPLILSQLSLEERRRLLGQRAAPGLDLDTGSSEPGNGLNLASRAIQIGLNVAGAGGGTTPKSGFVGSGGSPISESARDAMIAGGADFGAAPAAGAGASGGGVPWGQILMLAGLALKDATAASQGKQGTGVQDFAISQGGNRLREEAGQREQKRLEIAERGDVRAAEGDARERELFPMKKELTEKQLRRVQLETSKDFMVLYGDVDIDALSPEKQTEHRAAIRAEAQQLGVNPALVETIFMDRSFLRFLKPRIKAVEEDLRPEEAETLRGLMRRGKPAEAAGTMELAKGILQRAVERKAERLTTGFANALGRTPTAQEIDTRFADDPTVKEALFESPVLARLRQQYGLTGTKAAQAAEGRETPEEAVAKTTAVERAKKVFKGPDLSQDLKDILQRPGAAKNPDKPTDEEIGKAAKVQLNEKISVSAAQGAAGLVERAKAGLDLPLSREDAQALGVPFGTTPRQAQGIVPLSATQQEAATQFDAAGAAIKDIRRYSSKVNTATGPADRTVQGIAAWIGKTLQTNDDAVLLESKKGYMSLLVRSLGEKGTLNEGDINRALGLMPTLWDTKSIAGKKLDDLEALFDEIKKRRAVPSSERQRADPLGLRGKR